MKLIVDLQLRAANVYQGYDPAPYGDRKPMGAVSDFKPAFFGAPESSHVDSLMLRMLLQS